MNRRKFTLGSIDRLVVVLPSRPPGRPSVRRGKAKLRVGSLTCMVSIDVESEDIKTFFRDLRECHRQLRGQFGLKSLNGSFSLQGEMAPHGHVRVSVLLDSRIHRQIDDPQWSVSASFSCPADALVKAAAGAIEA